MTKGQWLLLVFICILGLFLRLDGINRCLEYDEIWPLGHFKEASFLSIIVTTDTSLLGNFHPITHAIVSTFANDEAITEWQYRLWSLLWGVLLIPLVAAYTYHFTRSAWSALLASFFCAVDPHLIHFSQTMRGYSMQCFFAVFLCYWLFHREYHKRFMIIAGIVTVVTILFLQGSVITSVLIWAPLSSLLLACKIFEYHKKQISFGAFVKQLLPMIIGCLLSLLWLGVTYEVLSEGTRHKILFEQRLWFPIWEITQPLVVWFFYLLCTVGLIILWRSIIVWQTAILLFSATVFVTITQLLGPTRVYVYLIPFMLIVSACAIETVCSKIKKYKSQSYTFAVAIVALSMLHSLPPKIKSLRGIDYKKTIPEILELQQRDYIIFRAHTGIIIHNYFRNVNQVNIFRLFSDQPPNLLVVQEHETSILSCFDMKNNREELLPIEEGETIKINDVKCLRIAIKPTSPEKVQNGLLLACIKITTKSQYQTFLDNMKAQEDWKAVNVLFTKPTRTLQGNIVAFLIATEVKSPQYKQKVLAKFPKAILYQIKR